MIWGVLAESRTHWFSENFEVECEEICEEQNENVFRKIVYYLK
jgi:hypothetical protein